MVGRVGSGAGGILTLVDTIDQHRGAFEYDWRTRFGVPLEDVPDVMAWSEAWRLFAVLALDPSSQVAAALAGWQFSTTREDVVLRDVADILMRANSKHKPKPYPRPWDKTQQTRIGSAAGMTWEEYRDLMARQTPDDETHP